jgi:superfamily II DNA or RNA helicase
MAFSQNDLKANFFQVIVNECHHVGAASFDAILKRTKVCAGPDGDAHPS